MPAVSPYFRRKIGRPKYPGLWEGCVGAWCPSRSGMTGATLYDFSGRNGHAALTGTALNAWTVNGTGWAFSGSGSTRFFQVPHESRFNMQRLSVSAWFRTTDSGTTNYLITKGENSFYFAINAVTSGKVGFFLNGVSSAWLESSVTVTDGLWHRATATYNGAQRELFVDGVSQGTSAGTGTVGTGTSTVQLGGRVVPLFTGEIDAWLIHNRALTPGEVRQLYSCRGAEYETLPPPSLSPPPTNLLDARRRAVVC